MHIYSRNPGFFLLSVETTSPDMMSMVYIRQANQKMICVHLERHLENDKEVYAMIRILDQETMTSKTLGVIAFPDAQQKFFKDPDSYQHPIEIITGPANHDWSNRDATLKLILEHAIIMASR